MTGTITAKRAPAEKVARRILNLDDIQGHVTRAYGRYSFPFARYLFLQIAETEAGREFVDQIRPLVTTAADWGDAKPKVTVNIGFSFFGLYMLGLPTRTLQTMPEAFVDGMKARAFILGDRDPTKTESESGAWCRHWDPIWQQNRMGKDGTDVHIWIGLNAQAVADGSDQPHPALEEQTEWLRQLCARLGQKVRILATNGPSGTEEYQSASAVFTQIGGLRVPTPREHFGLTDGIGDPVFEGQYTDPEAERQAVIGRGKWMQADKGWQPLAAGEFILGYPDESQELPPVPQPPSFSRNGSFMTYRKLHENVATFDAVIAAEAQRFARVMAIPEAEAVETLKAKMVGRWSDGVPMSVAPTHAEWIKVRADTGMDEPDPLKALIAQRDYLKSTAASNFRFADDMDGIKCPGGAHLRRVNTRDYLDPLNAPSGKNPKATDQLNKRRRVIRRGLPYGPTVPTERRDDIEQGVVMMTVGASIFRQFEFVQQQWIQYGLDFNQGNNTCPLVGNHEAHSRYTIPGDPRTGRPPYFMSGLKTFVECRGGEYFFLPSLTALQMMALGIVDPT
ncbi:MAG: peroxidase [Mangrovicoccus sp.]|nr:peroxidase [Mangrovicoccus sp.]